MTSLMLMTYVVAVTMMVVSTQEVDAPEWLSKWVRNFSAGTLRKSAIPPGPETLWDLMADKHTPGLKQEEGSRDDTTQQKWAAEPAEEATISRLIEHWTRMCPDVDADPGENLPQRVIDAAFPLGDINSNGRLEASELDTFEDVIEAYQLCSMMD